MYKYFYNTRVVATLNLSLLFKRKTQIKLFYRVECER